MKLETLEKGCYYHIFNRGINSAPLFLSEENMRYFLKLVEKYLVNKVAILSYCLLKNHYHLVIRVDCEPLEATRAFSNLFNAYAKAFNKMYDRTGSLFEKHFKRIRLHDEQYLRDLIVYVHTNPTHHNVSDYRTYVFSSFSHLLEEKVSFIQKEELISLFEDKENYLFVHKTKAAGKSDDLYPQFTDMVGDESPTDLQGSSESSEQHLAGLTAKVEIKNECYTLIRLIDATVEAFFTLINSNRAHICDGFPTTVRKCQTFDAAQVTYRERLQLEEEQKGRYFLLQHSQQDGFIGYFSLKNINTEIGRCEFAYFIDQNFEGRGVVSKLMTQMILFAFDELRMNKIIICTAESNYASQKVALKNGFLQEGILRKEYKKYNGQLEDLLQFGLLKSDLK
ncbi:GNAT family N-acetyltransferase [Sungkyunkwania multivorans]|uniref:GNAT family N-acetyltransferase n=1 Tax=Sungkyunkwania multivorans TaxID=1173618 RepID=A0ABW3CZR3_9FLAO